MQLGDNHKMSAARYPSRFELRVAIALNNMAVTMMERDCHQQAYDTFQDAVTTLKIPVRLGASSRRATHRRAPRSNNETSAQKLHQANLRLSRPQPSDRLLPLRVIKQHEAAAELLSKQRLLSSAQRRRASPMTLMRVDDLDLQFAAGQQKELVHEAPNKPVAACQLYVAIVIYNFAISSLCLARQGDDSLAWSHHSAGIKLLKVAKSLLGQLLDSRGPKKSPAIKDQVDDPLILAQVLCIATMVMESLVSALLESREEEEEAKSYLPKIAQLLVAGASLVCNDGSLFGAMTNDTACANLPKGAPTA